MSDSPTDIRLWSTDEAGQAVLRGLTFEETEWYLEFSDKELAQRIGVSKPWATPEAFEQERERWRALNRTHEHARAQQILSQEQQKIEAEEAKSRPRRRRY